MSGCRGNNISLQQQQPASAQPRCQGEAVDRALSWTVSISYAGCIQDICSIGLLSITQHICLLSYRSAHQSHLLTILYICPTNHICLLSYRSAHQSHLLTILQICPPITSAYSSYRSAHQSHLLTILQICPPITSAYYLIDQPTNHICLLYYTSAPPITSAYYLIDLCHQPQVLTILQISPTDHKC